MYYINNSLDTATRYDMIKFLKIETDNIDCLTSYVLYNIPNLKETGTYIVTNEAGRPDLLSYNLYQDTQYWWILLIYNSILNLEQLVTGLTISYPSISAIETLYLNASTYAKTIGQS